MKKILTGSTNGKGIKVTGTASGAAVTLHTVTTNVNAREKIVLNAYNAHSADVLLTLEIGGTGNLIRQTIVKGTTQQIVIPAMYLNGKTSAITIKAFAATANVIMMNGYVEEETIFSNETPVVPSGSTDGLPVLVAAVATPGTLIHTPSVADTDEITLYAHNSDTTECDLTLEIGDATTPMVMTIAPRAGLAIVLDKALLKTGTVRAFAETTNLISIYGFVTRIKG